MFVINLYEIRIKRISPKILKLSAWERFNGKSIDSVPFIYIRRGGIMGWNVFHSLGTIFGVTFVIRNRSDIEFQVIFTE